MLPIGTSSWASSWSKDSLNRRESCLSNEARTLLSAYDPVGMSPSADKSVRSPSFDAAELEDRSPPSRFDEVPEFGILRQRLILTGREARTKQEILEGIPTEDSMNDDPQLVSLKVNPIVP